MQWRVTWGEARLVVLGGVVLGLGVALVPTDFARRGAEEAVPGGAVVDPYAEARRSREILEAQEGAPPSAWRAPPGGRAPTAEVRSAEVQAAEAWAGRVDVIDGDTFRMGGQTIRIADIDTPELRGRCAHESALASRASRRMAALLAAGPFELHAVERDTDRYGRKLRIVTRAGRSLGDQLVAEGLARTWTGRREPWC